MHIFFYSVVFIVWFLFIGCSERTNDISIGVMKKFDSSYLNEERTVIISLPEGYEKSDARYPVLYVLDGMQNIWHTAGSHELLTRTGNIPPLIIVGIKSENRKKDFTHSSNKMTSMSGGGENFSTFLQKELIPYIEKNYKTHPYRILTGHSLGGLFTANTFIKYENVFDSFIIMSPAFWWNNEEVTSNLKLFLKDKKKLNKKVYLGIGAEDGYGMKQELKRFADVIVKEKVDGLSSSHKLFDNEGHMSAPLQITYHGLKFIFEDIQLPRTLWSTYSDSLFLAHENQMMETYGQAAKQSQESYVTLGFKLISEKNYSGAITVFKRNLEAYNVNKFARNHEWLANAYDKAGDIKNALQEYKNAYDLSLETGYGDKNKYLDQIKRLENI